jgi:virginiamycin B lyase
LATADALAVAFKEYRPPGGGIEGTEPTRIVAGPDGALWFTEQAATRIGRVTTSGSFSFFPLPSGGNTYGIAVGPDGRIWFTERTVNAPQIGAITTTGTITEYPLPSDENPTAIAAGPDGRLWFNTGQKRVGAITTDGVEAEYPTPHEARSLTPGPDGRVWFTEVTAVAAISPTGAVSEYPVSTSNPQLRGITTGPDGALWFALGARPVCTPGARPPCSYQAVLGRMTTSGNFKEFGFPGNWGDSNQITSGPDGQLWFTTFDGEGSMSTSGALRTYSFPSWNNEKSPATAGITTGPDGRVWFTVQSYSLIVALTPGGGGGAPPRRGCVVPRLKGLKLAAARTTLKAHHCALGRVTYRRTSAASKNKVIHQSPRPGKKLRRGAAVAVTVGRRPRRERGPRRPPGRSHRQA